jgi:alkylhydroperoxidase family enzyme
MPRLRQVPRDDAHPFGQTMYRMLFAYRDPVAEPGTETGTPGNWWTVFALVPDAFDHATDGFRFYRSPDRRLSPKLRELGQIRAGWTVGSQFVFSQHCKACRDVGFTDEQVAAIPSWQVADCFSPIERAVLAYTDALVLQRGRVPDAVFDALQAELSDEEILELTYVTATYMMHAVMCRALRLEYDDVDERVVEIADPTGRFGGLDVMAMVDDAPEDADGG